MTIFRAYETTKKLFTKRPKYREDKTIHFENNKLGIITDLRNLLKSDKRKMVQKKAYLMSRNQKEFQELDSTINHLSRIHKVKQFSCAYKKNRLGRKLETYKF